MEISKEHRSNIDAIKSTIECDSDFQCCESEFEDLVQVKELVHGQLWQCLAENPQQCKSAMLFGNAYLCQCPLRHYIAKNLQR